MRVTRAGTVLALLTAAYALVLAFLVLSPISDQLGALTVRISVDWTYRTSLPGSPTASQVEFALNVLLFVPVGILGGLALRAPWWVVVVVCALLSAGIEVVQAVPALQRTTSLRDVVANGTGGTLGVLVERTAASLLRPVIRSSPDNDRKPLR